MDATEGDADCSRRARAYPARAALEEASRGRWAVFGGHLIGGAYRHARDGAPNRGDGRVSHDGVPHMATPANTARFTVGSIGRELEIGMGL